jgi:hypothetical protein
MSIHFVYSTTNHLDMELTKDIGYGYEHEHEHGNENEIEMESPWSSSSSSNEIVHVNTKAQKK